MRIDGRRTVRATATVAAAALVLGLVAPGAGAATVTAPEVGSWASHGRTLQLRPDGSGTFAAWIGAGDGTLVDVRAVGSGGGGETVEVSGLRVVGSGALAPSEAPAVGQRMEVAFGTPVRTAHVRWADGVRSMSADLCPADVRLTATQLETLRCGA